jgi:flagellar biosynthesis/type III secretory pathway protein FliH
MSVSNLIARPYAGPERRPRILFEDDFDLPFVDPETEPPEPEMIEPLYTAAELQAACEQARQEADALARAECAAAQSAAVPAALAAIAEQLGHSVAEARAAIDRNAEAIARVLLGAFAAAFPALCRRHGEPEVQAVLLRILPLLESEPRVTVRVAPQLMHSVREALGQIDPETAVAIHVVPDETMMLSDVRVNWHSGQAVRDAGRLWQDIEDVLAPAGLLPPRPATRAPVARETADVQ